jgi:hypothetical protein
MLRAPTAAALTPEQVEDYRRDGFLSGIQAVTPAVASRNRALFDERERRENLGGTDAPVHYLSLHTEEQWAWELITSPAIVAAARALLGTDDVFCLATHAFVKAPRSGGFVGW